MKNKVIILLLLGFSHLSFGQWTLTSYDTALHNFKHVHFVNQDTGFISAAIGTLGNVILRTQDGGSSWDTTTTADIGVDSFTGFRRIQFVYDTIGYVSCIGEVVKTIDCGETWFPLDTGDLYLNAGNWYETVFINKDTGFISYMDGGSACLRTYDGGWTWEADPILLGVRNFNYYNGTLSACWGGWSKLDQTTMEWSMDIGILEEQTDLILYGSAITGDKIIVAGGVGGTAAYASYAESFDNGVSWRLRYLNMWQLLELQFLSDDLGYANSIGNGLYKTFDGGEVWYEMELVDDLGLGIDKQFGAYQMLNDTIGFAVSNEGFFKTTNGGGMIISPIDVIGELSIDNKKENIFRIYPNPVDNEINLSGSNASSIEIYDLSGNKIFSESSVDNSVDVSTISSGTYIARIYIKDQVLTKRFVKK